MLSAELYLNGTTVGRITIHNDGTGTEELGNYEFWFQSAALDIDYRGAFKNYPRVEGAWRLLEKIINCVHDQVGAEQLRYLGRIK